MKTLLPSVVISLLLVEIAWAIVRWLPSAEDRRFADLAERLAPDAPAAEICAEVDLAFRIRLTLEDIRVLKTLQARGLPAQEALDCVLTYRRALGE